MTGDHSVWGGTGNGHGTGRGKDAKFREVVRDLAHGRGDDAKGWVPGVICSWRFFF